MAVPINPTNRGLLQEKINSSSNSKNKAVKKLTDATNASAIADTNAQNSGVKLEISSESRIKSEELQNKKLIDNKESAAEMLSNIKQQAKNIIKAQANSIPQNVINLLA